LGAVQPDKPKSRHSPTEDMGDSHWSCQEGRPPTGHSPRVHMLDNTRPEPISPFSYELCKVSEAAKILMDPIRAINRQLTAKAA